MDAVMRALALLLCLLSAQAWGTVRYATPSGGATTGTCPVDTPCTLDRCRLLSVGAGDICYLNAGTYSEGINTGAANTGEIITFECVTGNANDCILNGFAQGTTDRVVQMDTSGYRISKLTIIVPALGTAGSGSRYGVRMEATGDSNEVVDSIFYAEDESDPTNTTDIQWAIQARGTNFVVSRNTISHVGVGINANTNAAAPTGDISYNVFSDLSQGDEEDSDCINVGATTADSSYGLRIHHNTCADFRDDGIDLFGATNVIVEDNVVTNPAQSTTSNSGIKGGGCKTGPTNTTGNIIRRNFVNMIGAATQRNYGMVVNGLSDGFIESNIFIADDQTAIEVAQCGVSPFGGGDNNTLRNNIFFGGDYGIYVRATASGTLAYNNVFVGATQDVNIETGVSVTGSNNALLGTNSVGGAGTYTSSDDITSGEAGWTGGTSPTTAAGFCLAPDSPLLAAGTYLGAWATGYAGHDLGNPPAIGARGTCQGRPLAATRPAASRAPLE